jgi:hypothetical protein
MAEQDLESLLARDWADRWFLPRLCQAGRVDQQAARKRHRDNVSHAHDVLHT